MFILKKVYFNYSVVGALPQQNSKERCVPKRGGCQRYERWVPKRDGRWVPKRGGCQREVGAKERWVPKRGGCQREVGSMNARCVPMRGG
jgi:hypothetical protein